jgi:hypothetical protein
MLVKEWSIIISIKTTDIILIWKTEKGYYIKLAIM